MLISFEEVAYYNRNKEYDGSGNGDGNGDGSGDGDGFGRDEG